MRSLPWLTVSAAAWLVLAAEACGAGGNAGVDAGTDDAGALQDAGASDGGALEAGGEAGDPDAVYRPRREACEFGAGAHVADTLGIDEATRSAIPLTHVIVFMQENRSFDHYLGRLGAEGHDVDGFSDAFTNPDASGGAVTPLHAETTCITPDISHTWDAMQEALGRRRPRPLLRRRGPRAVRTASAPSPSTTSATCPSTTSPSRTSRWPTGASARCSARPGRTATTSTRPRRTA